MLYESEHDTEKTSESAERRKLGVVSTIHAPFARNTGGSSFLATSRTKQGYPPKIQPLTHPPYSQPSSRPSRAIGVIRKGCPFLYLRVQAERFSFSGMILSRTEGWVSCIHQPARSSISSRPSLSQSQGFASSSLPNRIPSKLVIRPTRATSTAWNAWTPEHSSRPCMAQDKPENTPGTRSAIPSVNPLRLRSPLHRGEMTLKDS